MGFRRRFNYSQVITLYRQKIYNRIATIADLTGSTAQYFDILFSSSSPSGVTTSRTINNNTIWAMNGTNQVTGTTGVVYENRGNGVAGLWTFMSYSSGIVDPFAFTAGARMF